MNKEKLPLAERLRPKSLRDFFGQEHVVGKGKLLRTLVEQGELVSLVLWGPPGSGKTTLASIIAATTRSAFVPFSAVTAGVKDLRQAVEEARQRQQLVGKSTIVFIDEVHRFNKAQQDFFLPFVERGVITFIGATTENPSFSVNAALLSRSRVLVLEALGDEAIGDILERALGDDLLASYTIEDEAKRALVRVANGDARVVLNTLELAAQLASDRVIVMENVEQALQRKALLYDKAGEEHYNIISALHKSMRGGDPQASLYWLGRMLEAGEDPLYVVRRLIRFASEDVGMADPQALGMVIAVRDTIQAIGMPEANTALAQAVVYLAVAPKSNALYSAYQQVQRVVVQSRNEPVPLHLRNAPTELMRELSYGKGYLYPHDAVDKVVVQKYFPDAMEEVEFYRPGKLGFEREVQKRMLWWREKREKMG